MPELSEELIRHIARTVVQENAANITREEAASIAAAAARTAVQESNIRMWAQMGYDLANMKDVDRLRKNFTFLESLRGGTSAIGRAVASAITLIIVGAICTAIWLGAKFALHTPPNMK